MDNRGWYMLFITQNIVNSCRCSLNPSVLSNESNILVIEKGNKCTLSGYLVAVLCSIVWQKQLDLVIRIIHLMKTSTAQMGVSDHLLEDLVRNAPLCHCFTTPPSDQARQSDWISILFSLCCRKMWAVSEVQNYRPASILSLHYRPISFRWKRVLIKF